MESKKCRTTTRPVASCPAHHDSSGVDEKFCPSSAKSQTCGYRMTVTRSRTCEPCVVPYYFQWTWRNFSIDRDSNKWRAQELEPRHRKQSTSKQLAKRCAFYFCFIYESWGLMLRNSIRQFKDNRDDIRRKGWCCVRSDVENGLVCPSTVLVFLLLAVLL